MGCTAFSALHGAQTHLDRAVPLQRTDLRERGADRLGYNPTQSSWAKLMWLTYVSEIIAASP